MDNYTTSETSWKLKEKGFPQPKIDRGQIWFDTDGASYESNKFSKLDLRHFAYAATPADILKELGPAYIFFYMTGVFYCNRVGIDSKSWAHENPAECLSLAFMDK